MKDQVLLTKNDASQLAVGIPLFRMGGEGSDLEPMEGYAITLIYAEPVAYIIDCVIIGSFILMLIIVAMKVVPESNKELFYTGFGLLGTLAVTTINFHRGTSKGSENKQAFINKMMTK